MGTKQSQWDRKEIKENNSQDEIGLEWGSTTIFTLWQQCEGVQY